MQAQLWFQSGANLNETESLLLNGVGQSPALDLRMVAPTPSLTATPDVPPPTPTPTELGPTTLAAITAPVVTVVEGHAGKDNPYTGMVSTVPQTPAGLLLTLPSAPVGMPSLAAEHVAAVGTGNGPGSATAALAYDGALPPAGILLDLNPEGASEEVADAPESLATDGSRAARPARAAWKRRLPSARRRPRRRPRLGTWGRGGSPVLGGDPPCVRVPALLRPGRPRDSGCRSRRLGRQ